MMNAETTWFHLFRSMIVGGDLREMGAPAFAVYCTIKAHVDFSTGAAFPSVARIQELTGMGKRSVLRALQALEYQGYLSKERVGRKNVYRLREKVSISDTEGRPEAVATWDYLPRTVQDAQAELKNFLLSGQKDGSIIHIEHLNLQVNIGGTNTQENYDLGERASRVSDPKLRATLERIAAKRQTAKAQE